MTAGVLVAGIGNIFLTDDGFGPEVVRHLAAEPEPLPDGVRLVDYGIRGLHLAYDLLAADLDALVLVDAVSGEGAPGSLSLLEIGPDDLEGGPVDAHGMDPVAVLAAVPKLGGRLPATYLVGARPVSLAEGIGLTEQLRVVVPEAAAAVRRLLARLFSDHPAMRGV